MRHSWQYLCTLVLLAVFSLSTFDAFAAKKTEYTPEQALEISQHALGKIVGDHDFTDQNGKKVSLADFRGKPLVINMIYTSCSHTCGVITARLEDALDVAWEAMERDSFNVITVGFETAIDTPARMKNFAVERGVDNVDGWTFLSGDEYNIAQLVKETGFLYYDSPKGYDHLAQVTIIDKEGRVDRQVYGENFETPLFVEPLRDLIFGTKTPLESIADIVNKVKLICTIYDPKADRYRFDYSIFMQLFAGITVMGTVIILLLREIWRNRRRQKTPPL